MVTRADAINLAICHGWTPIWTPNLTSIEKNSIAFRHASVLDLPASEGLSPAIAWSTIATITREHT
jgi:hypothetical protein